MGFRCKRPKTKILNEKLGDYADPSNSAHMIEVTLPQISREKALEILMRAPLELRKNAVQGSWHNHLLGFVIDNHRLPQTIVIDDIIHDADYAEQGLAMAAQHADPKHNRESMGCVDRRDVLAKEMIG